MKSLVLLNEADQSRLHAIIHRSARPPHPDLHHASLLQALLSSAGNPAEDDDLSNHVGLGDLITLVSPHDSQDYYKFRIVMPHDADVDRDHISICTPIAEAVLGRPVGKMVEWNVPAGIRRMRIIAVGKSDS